MAGTGRTIPKRRIKVQKNPRSTRIKSARCGMQTCQMTNSTTLSGKPSLPVTRYRLFKSFAAAKGLRPDLFTG